MSGFYGDKCAKPLRNMLYGFLPSVVGVETDAQLASANKRMLRRQMHRQKVTEPGIGVRAALY
jgi:hypothetical protein